MIRLYNRQNRKIFGCIRTYRLTVTEVYATALHYTPCQVTDDGFGCIVALPEGTNTPLDTESKDKLLTAKNKWLLAHTENKAKIKQGAVAGITGENIFIHY